MTCKKVRYTTKDAALDALTRIWTQPGKVGRKREIRCYRCRRCKGWHLTSKLGP